MANEQAEKLSISLPSSLLKEIDQKAASWFTSRSGAIARIYLEWRQANQPQVPAAIESPIAEVSQC